MTGKQSKLVLEWLSEFINDPTVSYDQRDIDFFINNLSRNDWIERAWDIFMFIIQTIQSESYDVTVCLSFTLEPYNRPKKASNYFIKTKALSKSSPPGISLMRGRYQHFIKESTYSSLNSYDKKYKRGTMSPLTENIMLIVTSPLELGVLFRTTNLPFGFKRFALPITYYVFNKDEYANIVSFK